MTITMTMIVMLMTKLTRGPSTESDGLCTELDMGCTWTKLAAGMGNGAGAGVGGGCGD